MSAVKHESKTVKVASEVKIDLQKRRREVEQVAVNINRKLKSLVKTNGLKLEEFTTKASYCGTKIGRFIVFAVVYSPIKPKEYSLYIKVTKEQLEQERFDGLGGEWNPIWNQAFFTLIEDESDVADFAEIAQMAVDNQKKAKLEKATVKTAPEQKPRKVIEIRRHI